jgi:hypothetical protein
MSSRVHFREAPGGAERCQTPMPGPVPLCYTQPLISSNLEEIMDDGSKQFELSIWRPARFSRVVNYVEPIAGGFERALLLEQIYSWDPGSMAPWNSVLDGNKSRLLRDSLVEGFAPNLPPNQRTVQALEDFANSLRLSLEDSDFSSWNDLPQSMPDSDSSVLRCNLARAFSHYLDWIVSTFRHVPGASVIIR